MSDYWLLIEWLDETDSFSAYGVVNERVVLSKANSRCEVGKIVFIRNKHTKDIRQGKILGVSDNKWELKQQKTALEKRMKNVVSLCVNTVKNMLTETMFTFPKAGDSKAIPGPSSRKTIPNESDTENEEGTHIYNSSSGKRRNVLPKKTKYKRELDCSSESELSNPIRKTSSKKSPYYAKCKKSPKKTYEQAMIHSTPISRSHHRTSDVGVQTEDNASFISLKSAEDIENNLNELAQVISRIIPGLEISNNERFNRDKDHHNVEIVRNDIFEEQSTLCNNTESNEISKEIINLNLVNKPDEKILTDQSLNGNNFNALDSDGCQIVVRKSKGKKIHVRRSSAQTTEKFEIGKMISIGENTQVPATLINQIDWSSHTNATRQLLQAVFSRKTLATHSLSGRPSPAFRDKPAKKPLDPKVIDDIVQIVSKRCNVPSRSVRTAITIKCADENKLYRKRQAVVRNKENQENVVPSVLQAVTDSSLATPIKP